jgi:hypothetical protein
MLKEHFVGWSNKNPQIPKAALAESVYSIGVTTRLLASLLCPI